MLKPKIKVDVSTEVTQCSCCQKKNLKRTIYILLPEGGELHLGVVCGGRWFNMNLTGNVYYSAAKLERYINTLDVEELEDVIENIKEAASK